MNPWAEKREHESLIGTHGNSPHYNDFLAQGFIPGKRKNEAFMGTRGNSPPYSTFLAQGFIPGNQEESHPEVCHVSVPAKQVPVQNLRPDGEPSDARYSGGRSVF